MSHIEDFFSYHDCQWGTLTEFMDFSEQDEVTTRATLQKMVERGKIRLREGEGEAAWEIVPPEVPAFIAAVAEAVGYVPGWQRYPMQGKVASYNYGNCLDYDIYLDPMIRESWYTREADLDKIRQEARDRGRHVLKFRNVIEYGDNCWICFLKEWGRCYVQSEGGEDNPAETPEKAFRDLLERQAEEINLMTHTFHSLRKAWVDQQE